MQKKLFLLFIFCTISTSAFAIKVFKYSVEGTPTSLDPVQSSTKYQNRIVSAICDTLYDYKYLKIPYELKPNLAAALPKISKDGLTYTIQIKKGVFFSDDPAFKGGKGRELTAEDFVYSIKRHFDPKTLPRGAWLWQGRIKGIDDWKTAGSDYKKQVEGLKAIDKYTIQISLVKPYPQLVYTLTKGYSAIVAKEVVEKYGPEISIHPVGSGPWVLGSFNNQKAVLLKNKKYREEIFDLKNEGYDEKIHGFTGIKSLQGKKLPIVDQIEINFMENFSMRWISFTKGSEIQFGFIPEQQFNNVIASRNPLSLNKEYAQKYYFLPQTEFAFRYLNFNMDDPKIGYNKDKELEKKNKALRIAIHKAWDWPQYIKTFFDDLGEAYPGIISPGIDGYDPTLSKEYITHDPEGAKKILKDNGWTAANLPDITYSMVSDIRQNQMYDQFRGWLITIGYPSSKIKKQTFASFGDYSKAVKSRKTMTIAMAWGLDFPDSENVLQLFYGPNSSPGSNNSNYNNPEYNALYEKASTMQPSKERSEIYKKMHKLLLEDSVTIAGFSRTDLWVWHKNVILYPVENVLGNYFKYVDIK